MTIPEAVSLILQAAVYAEGGEIFVLDMGKPVRIFDLAKKIIRYKGLEPGKDIEIKIIGAREGERIYEPLWLKEENPQKTEYEKLLVLKNIEFGDEKLDCLLTELEPICKFMGDEEKFRNKEKLLSTLRKNISSLDEYYKVTKKDESMNL